MSWKNEKKLWGFYTKTFRELQKNIFMEKVYIYVFFLNEQDGQLEEDQ